MMIADGNISREAARALLEQDTTWTSDPSLRDHGSHHILYACNAVIRSGPLRQTLFDENLPLYSYGEDYELSLRLKKFGRVGRLSSAVGVHLQTQAAPVSGKRYGYAMIANNWYFLQKGVCHIAAPWVTFVRAGHCLEATLDKFTKRLFRAIRARSVGTDLRKSGCFGRHNLRPILSQADPRSVAM
jgi:GT2 family glycosyltransferase